MLKFFGSGGAFNIERGNTSAYMELADELILFDVGEDVFPKIIKSKVLENKTRVNIFITHLHSDHVGGLATLIAYLYFKHFQQDMSNICIYFPSEAICDFLCLQGVPRKWYNLFVNKWDELFIAGFHKQPEYAFYETTHTDSLDYKGACNSFSIEFMLQDQFSIFYSGDTNSFHSKLANIHNYDYVYQEVTCVKEANVHFYYEDLLEATKNYTREEKNKIYLMHLDENFDEARAIEDGYQVVQNITLG